MPLAVQAKVNEKLPVTTKPTFYFVGVTTGQSSIMRVFPRWAEYLGLGDVHLQGIDCKQHDDPDVYRHVVQFIKDDPLSLGGLVTTHKIDLLAACRDLFDELDAHAGKTGEISCIFKRDGKLCGSAKDPISSGLALEAFLPENHWKQTGAECFLMGAGGSSIALTSYFSEAHHGLNVPSRIVITNRSQPRLDAIEQFHKSIRLAIPTDYRLARTPQINDEIMASLQPHSMVINATGLGKDAPGSPITNDGQFPQHGLAWEFNYRGDLVFLDQANAQKDKKKLTIEDGWVYFLHGWTRVIADVFDIDIPTRGPSFDELSRIARNAR